MEKKIFLFGFLVFLFACKKNDFLQEKSNEITAFNANTNEVTPGMLMIFTTTKIITKDTATAQIGNIAATLIKLDSFRMGMWVPVIPIGNYNINLKNAGGQDSLPVRVLPYNTITDPKNFLINLQKDAGSLTDSLEGFQSGGLLAGNELKFLRELKSRIDSKLSRLNPVQSELLAYLTDEFITNQSSLSLPTLDTALIFPRFNPEEQLADIVNLILPIHQNINKLSSVNLTAGDLWNTISSDLNEAAYLLSLQLYMIEKCRAVILNKQISSFACIAEGGLSIKDGATGAVPVRVIRGRYINQRLQVNLRTINQSDENLLNGKVKELFNLSNGLAKSDLTINQKWSRLQSKYNDLTVSIPTTYVFYTSPLPVLSKYKTFEVPPTVLVISKVSEPGISVVGSTDTDGALRLSFNSDINTIADGTKFNIRINYNQDLFNRSVSMAQQLSFENYPNVMIGGRIWMQENTTVKNFRNGESIPYVSWGPTWATLKTPAWCYYNNDPASEATYGLLYNWYAVNDSRGFAPEGWHVASDTEWKEIIAFLGGSAEAGGKLKAVSPLWNAPNTGATNSSGFSALPAGSRGNGGTYVNLGRGAAWWTANQYGPNGSWSYYASYNSSSATRGGASKQDGYSVRCVKD